MGIFMTYHMVQIAAVLIVAWFAVKILKALAVGIFAGLMFYKSKKLEKALSEDSAKTESKVNVKSFINTYRNL